MLVKSNGLVKPCCMPSNTVRVHDPKRPDLTIMVCKTCGARHITMNLEPGRIFTRT